MKYINFDVELYDTTTPWEPIIHHIYTLDSNSIIVSFTCTDVLGGFPSGTTAKMYIYTSNTSFFPYELTSSDINDNVISWQLDPDITKHWGTNKIQAEITMDGKTYATPIRLFSINQGLEAEVVNAVMIPEWTTFIDDTESFFQSALGAENNRISAENSRNIEEVARIAAETVRNTKESQRQVAEANRIAAEGLRINAETARDIAEGLRDSAETIRISAESTRSGAEAIRISAENARDGAEIIRNTAENARDGAEIARNTAEGLRDNAEIIRISAEGNRISAETARNTAENARKIFENYSSSKDYVVGNKVAYLGSSYYAIENSKGKSPDTETNYWLLMAQKGQTGNISNLEDWHISNALGYVPANAANMHDENVKNILNKFSEVSGKLYYDGNSISGISMGSTEPTDGSWWFEEIT